MAADPNVDPFAAMGGGVFVNGGWAPKNNANAIRAYGGTPETTANAAPVPGPIQGPNAPRTQTASQAVTQNATVGATPQQGSQTNVAGAYQQAMVNKLAPAPVNAQNPAVKQSIDANRLAGQRGFERDRNMLAERAAAGGYDGSGAFDSQLLGLAQNRTAREGAYEGQALGQLQRDQDNQIMAALGMGGQMLGQQGSLDLQRYGIDTDAALRREGLGSQSALGGRELDIRDRLGTGNLNLGLLGLLQGGDQFGQSLGAQLGMFNANRSSQDMLGILGLL